MNEFGNFIRRADLIKNLVDREKLAEQSRKPNRTIQEANRQRWLQYQEILRSELTAKIASANATGGIDADARAFITAAAITGATQQLAIDNLVKGLKTDGLWSKMKAVYPFVTDNRNVLGYTEDFSNAYWNKQSATVSTNTTTAPDGTLTADTSLFSSILPSFVRASTIPITSGQTYTISVYVKKSSSGGADNIRITTNNTIAWNTGISQKFSLTTSWQRITLTGVLNSSANVCHIIFGSTNVDGTVDNSCGGNVDIWGAQMELGSTATTYQPIATTQQAFISSQFKYNLVNPVDSDAAFRLVFNGGWTHSSNGATPNGTNGYADTKLNGTELSVNSQALTYYSRTNTNVVAGTDIGISGVHRNGLALLRTYFGTPNTSVNDISDSTSIGAAQTTSINNSTGYFIGSRISATSNKLYRAGVSVASNTTNWGILSSLAFPFFIGSNNSSGTAAGFTNRQCAFSSIGDGLTDTEAANLYTRVQAFQTALSRQV